MDPHEITARSYREQFARASGITDTGVLDEIEAIILRYLRGEYHAAAEADTVREFDQGQAPEQEPLRQVMAEPAPKPEPCRFVMGWCATHAQPAYRCQGGV